MESCIQVDRFPAIAFRGVKNSEQIMSAVSTIASSEGDGDSLSIRIAVIDVSSVISAFHIQVAAYKALLNERQGCMKTKSITSEVLYQLSASTKISESVWNLGIKPDAADIAFVYVPIASSSATELTASSGPGSSSTISASATTTNSHEVTEEELKAKIRDLFRVDGEEIAVSELLSEQSLTAEKKAHMMRLFKISTAELEATTLEDAIITKLAVKDFL
jgi:tRNA threonylcarbamoyladenosine modification (KEOPS) complex Cgi121 subunit